MWAIVTGLAFFGLGIFVLLLVLSPRGDQRPLVFRCQRCGQDFGSPPIHPLPERYQEEDLCLCDACSAEAEERVRHEVRRVLADFIQPPDVAGGNDNTPAA